MKTFWCSVVYLMSGICFLSLLEVDFSALPLWKVLLSIIPYIMMMETFHGAWPASPPLIKLENKNERNDGTTNG